MQKKTSYIINFVLLLLIALAFLFDSISVPYQLLLSVGLFGLSGSLTNSLAIHMLFERIPLVYGSGIIALNFQEIKQDLEELMIRQFFNIEQIGRFLKTEFQSTSLDLTQIIDVIDFDVLFDKFKAGLAGAFQGNPMMLMALPLLDANRAKIIEAMSAAVLGELQKPKFGSKVQDVLDQQFSGHKEFEQRVRLLIRGRLEEMTPKMVKDIIQHMMESKLIWLVIWGAVIGALIGLATGLLRYYFFAIS